MHLLNSFFNSNSKEKSPCQDLPPNQDKIKEIITQNQISKQDLINTYTYAGVREKEENLDLENKIKQHKRSTQKSDMVKHNLSKTSKSLSKKVQERLQEIQVHRDGDRAAEKQYWDEIEQEQMVRRNKNMEIREHLKAQI